MSDLLSIILSKSINIVVNGSFFLFLWPSSIMCVYIYNFFSMYVCVCLCEYISNLYQFIPHFGNFVNNAAVKMVCVMFLN